MKASTFSSPETGTLPLFKTEKDKTNGYKVIDEKIIVNSSIKEVWEKLGIQFDRVSDWASDVNHTEARDNQGIDGSVCTVRGCEINGFGTIAEKLLYYSNIKHEFAYLIVEGMPRMVKFATNSWKVRELTNDTCEVRAQMKVKPAGLMGVIMGGMMVKGFRKSLIVLMEDFKFYAENGKPHPRKINVIAKVKS